MSRVRYFPLTTEGTGGIEKIKAAARSVESWRCFSNIQMTEGGGLGAGGRVGGY